MLSRELYIMRYDKDTYPLPAQLLKQGGQPVFGGRIKSLGGLVQQQNIRLHQQHHGKRGLLLLPSAEIMRMTLQHLPELEYLKQNLNLACCCFRR